MVVRMEGERRVYKRNVNNLYTEVGAQFGHCIEWMESGSPFGL